MSLSLPRRRRTSRPLAGLSLVAALAAAMSAVAAGRTLPPTGVATTSPDTFASQGTRTMTEIQSDIRKIVGGHFTPDALSPEIHGAIAARAKARASEYLDVFDSMYLGVNFDAFVQSELYLPSFLELVMPSAPDRATASARALLRMYDAVMVLYDHAADQPRLLTLEPDETRRLVERMNVRRLELRTLVR